MSNLTVYWETPKVQEYREKRLASLFKGYRFVLKVLAEIHPGFVSILNAHNDNAAENCNKPWNPVIYKVISPSQEEKIIYLIGSIHTRTLMPMQNALSYDSDIHAHKKDIAAQILSPELREILDKSEAIAFELDPKSISTSFIEKVQKIQKTPSEVTLTRSDSNLAFTIAMKGVLFVKTLGLDYSASTYLSDSSIARLSLESEETQLKSLEEIKGPSSAPRCSDLENQLEFYDLISQSDADSIKMYSIDTLQRNPQFERNCKWRNIQMVDRIFENMKKYKTMIVMVGAFHLYGESGVINLLQKKDGVTVIQMESNPIEEQEDATYLQKLLENEKTEAKIRAELLAWEATAYEPNYRGPKLSDLD